MGVHWTSETQWRPGRRVAIIGAGPGGVSTAMAMKLQGYDVRLYERAREPKALGGGVLLSVPVLAVLRSYGIDIEDGYFLTRAFDGQSLTNEVVARGTARYDDERVEYCNKNVEFARDLGNRFHHSGALTARIRDLVLDHTPILQRSLNKNSLNESAKMSLRLKELHVA